MVAADVTVKLDTAATSIQFVNVQQRFETLFLIIINYLLFDFSFAGNFCFKQTRFRIIQQ